MGLMLSGVFILLRLKSLFLWAYFWQRHRFDKKSSYIPWAASSTQTHWFWINLQTLLPRKFNNLGFSGLPVIRK